MTDHNKTLSFYEWKLDQLRRLLNEAERCLYAYSRAIFNYCSLSPDNATDDSRFIPRYVDPKRRAFEEIEQQIVGIMNYASSQPELAANNRSIIE